MYLHLTRLCDIIHTLNGNTFETRLDKHQQNTINENLMNLINDLCSVMNGKFSAEKRILKPT